MRTIGNMNNNNIIFDKCLIYICIDLLSNIQLNLIIECQCQLQLSQVIYTHILLESAMIAIEWSLHTAITATHDAN